MLRDGNQLWTYWMRACSPDGCSAVSKLSNYILKVKPCKCWFNSKGQDQPLNEILKPSGPPSGCNSQEK